MNYGILFSTELQKMAREINFDPNKGVGDNTDTFNQMSAAAQNKKRLAAGADYAVIPKTELESGYVRPRIVGTAGRTPNQSNAAMDRVLGRKVANR